MSEKAVAEVQYEAKAVNWSAPEALLGNDPNSACRVTPPEINREETTALSRRMSDATLYFRLTHILSLQWWDCLDVRRTSATTI